MKPNGKFNILNLTPQVQISNHDLEAIRHIVDIAPQEAQWYHTLSRDIIGNYVVYTIEGMYIPEQWTSAASVETSETMMVDFFKELRQEHGVEKVNEIISSMTCWCHSHHNMGVSPSGQDHKQFNEQCENAKNQNITNPQAMFIFNKKDKYYCRIWDPEFNLVFENVELYEKPYDFSWIDKQAKSKFKKKVYTRKPSWSASKTKSSFLDWQPHTLDEAFYGEIASTKDEFKVLYPHLKITPVIMKALNQSKKQKSHQKLIESLTNIEESELRMFANLCEFTASSSTEQILSLIDSPKFENTSTENLLSSIDTTLEALEFEDIECALMIALNLDTIDLIAALEDYDSLVVTPSGFHTGFTNII